MQKRDATAAAQITVAVVAVAAALVLGFIVGAASQSAPVLKPLPPPGATLPASIAVLNQTLTLPPANLAPSFAANEWGFWDASMANGTLYVVWNAPFVIDACASFGTGPSRVDNFTDCLANPPAIEQLNRTGGKMTFTVPDVTAGLTFYALSPRGQAGYVSYTFWMNSSTGQLEFPGIQSGVSLPLGQPLPPYVWENLSVPLPTGYNAVTVVGNASQPVSIRFNLAYYSVGGWQPVSTWNVSGYYPATPELNITIMAMSPISATVNLGAVAFAT